MKNNSINLQTDSLGRKTKAFRYVKLGLFAVIFLVLNSCKDENGDDKKDFDRKTMLQHFADSLIRPAFTRLQSEAGNLRSMSDSFALHKDSLHLSALQNQWVKTYTEFMHTCAFNFGPAGEEGLRKSLVEEIGTWPANASVIESQITAGNYALNDFNRDARGLGALDYLLFDINNNHQAVLNLYKSGSNRTEYLKALVNKIKTQVDEVANQWNSTYAVSFVENNGTSVGSSVSQCYNEFVKSFESMKNFKLAIPLGLRAGQSAAEPAKVEARYSRLSAGFLKLHWQALVRQWYGRTANGYDGPGWKEYLEFVTGGTELVLRTEAQINQINTMMENLPAGTSLENQVSSNFTALSNLHTELQKNTRNFKSDMSSLLGIAITYSSGDGD